MSEHTFIPFSQQTIPADCFVRELTFPGIWYKLLMVTHSGVMIAVPNTSQHKGVTFTTLQTGYEYSTDSGQTWHPCETES